MQGELSNPSPTKREIPLFWWSRLGICYENLGNAPEIATYQDIDKMPSFCDHYHTPLCRSCVGLLFPTVLAMCRPPALAPSLAPLALWSWCFKMRIPWKIVNSECVFPGRISLAPLCGEMRVFSCRAYLLRGKSKINFPATTTLFNCVARNRVLPGKTFVF